MSADEIRRARKRGGSSQRPIEPPSLPEGPLRTFKMAMYDLYLDARQPTLTELATAVAELAQRLASHLFPADGGDGEAVAPEVPPPHAASSKRADLVSLVDWFPQAEGVDGLAMVQPVAAMAVAYVLFRQEDFDGARVALARAKALYPEDGNQKLLRDIEELLDAATGDPPEVTSVIADG